MQLSASACDHVSSWGGSLQKETRILKTEYQHQSCSICDYLQYRPNILFLTAYHNIQWDLITLQGDCSNARFTWNFCWFPSCILGWTRAPEVNRIWKKNGTVRVNQPFWKKKKKKEPETEKIVRNCWKPFPVESHLKGSEKAKSNLSLLNQLQEQPLRGMEREIRKTIQLVN